MPGHTPKERAKKRRAPRKKRRVPRKESRHVLTSRKAKTMLREGKVRGKKLTKKQRGLFGLIAGGKRPTRMKKRA